MASRSGKEVAVEVIVRVRPLLETEQLQCKEECVSSVSEKQLVLGNEHQFTFHRVLPAKTSQASVYEECAVPLVTKFLDGFNTTILAYGQTGTGKTFTMGSGPEVDVDTQNKGIIPRSLQAVFDSLKDVSPPESYLLTVSYTEVYKDELRDLLNDTTPSRSIQLREREDGNIVVSGVTEVPVSTVRDALQCLKVGNANRITGATKMNKRSSRSHAVFTLRAEIVKCVLKMSTQSSEGDLTTNRSHQEQGRLQKISPKFHFVDLAGSERFGQTGNEGNRFKESIHINSGLLALGNVISALGETRRKTHHIPYRDSKITRLLKDSLGGNAKTVMLACVSPATSSYAETLNTLKYAQRASLIKNKPVVNCNEVRSNEIEVMKTEIAALKEELHRTRTIAPSSAPSSETFVVSLEDKMELKKKIISLEEELAKCRADLATDEDMFADKVQQIESYQEQVDQLTNLNSKLTQALSQAQTKEKDLCKEIEMLSHQVSTLEGELKAAQNRVSATNGDPQDEGPYPSPLRRRMKLDFTLNGLLSALSSKNDRILGQRQDGRGVVSGHGGEVIGFSRDGRVVKGDGEDERVVKGEGDSLIESEGLEQMRSEEIAIDKELEKMLVRKRALDQLEKDLHQRESALTKREAILAERDLLDAKRMRASQILHKKQTKLSVKLASLEHSIIEEEEVANKSGSNTLTNVQRHILELKQERDLLLRQHSSLHEKIRSEAFLSAEEERRLVEVSEWLEAIEAAIEYQDKQITSRQNRTQLSVEIQEGSTTQLLRKLQGLPPPITQHLLARYLEKVNMHRQHLVVLKHTVCMSVKQCI
jgi:hypothetical protein